MIGTLVVEGDVTLPDNFMYNTKIHNEVDISNCSKEQPFLKNVTIDNEITVYVKTEELKTQYESSTDYSKMKFVVKTGE